MRSYICIILYVSDFFSQQKCKHYQKKNTLNFSAFSFTHSRVSSVKEQAQEPLEQMTTFCSLSAWLFLWVCLYAVCFFIPYLL